MSMFKNERGFTLWEVLIAIAILSFVLIMGYQLMLNAYVKTMEEVTDTSVQGVVLFNEHVLKELHYAENIEIIQENNTIILFYNNSSLQFSLDVANNTTPNDVYQVTLNRDGTFIKELFQVQTDHGVQPVNYEDNSIQFNFSVKGVYFDYAITRRKGV